MELSTRDNREPFALVVDDEPLIRMHSCGILEDAGFRTMEADNVDAAARLLQESGCAIQLLFTDVQMPGDLDGYWLARECAHHWPHITILVVSGRSRPGPEDLPSGAVFMGKPFSAEAVKARLNELLPDSQKPEPLKQAFNIDGSTPGGC